LYNGINPKNLSTALGCNAFKLASPGTNATDNYFALVEGIKVNKPKVVIIETYGLKRHDQLKLEKGGLSDQFKSFSARKNVPLKVLSTPYLFAVKNYVYAWSNTIRNHDFLYKDIKQIKENIRLSKKRKKKEKLYLGRFVTSISGIEDSTLLKYQKTGAPVNGMNYEENAEVAECIQKIIDVCDENDIKLFFVTAPMYEKHISNYSVWKERLASMLGSYSSDEFWLDMQVGDAYRYFSRHSFHDTYKANQHLTYTGALLATYKLVDFLQNKEGLDLPYRKEDSKWRNLFYGDEGFFENNTPFAGDVNNLILDKSSTNEFDREILLLKRGDYNSLIVKISPKNVIHSEQLKSKKINLNLLIKGNNNELQNVSIEIPCDLYHSSKKNINYMINLQPFDVLKINSLQFNN